MRKQSESGTTLKYPTITDSTSGPNSDSDNEEPIPSTSNGINDHPNPSWLDSNNELLKENPFLIPSVLACLCQNSCREGLFNYRLVGQHIWNELAVNVINQDKSMGVRLVKVVDPNQMDRKIITRTGNGVLINIKELISTLRAGGLEKSTLTRIYLNASLTNFDLTEFLQLNGQNIRILHYDGKSLKDLIQILQTCANNLMSLSLWSSWEENEEDKNKEGPFKNDDDATLTTLKFPRLENFVIVSGELNPRMSSIYINTCNPSKEFLTRLFQASPNLKSLSTRFYESSVLDSGLSFKNLTTLSIKFRIKIPQLRALCDVGLRLKKLRLQGLFIKSGPQEEEDDYSYWTDPEWMEFRKILLVFIETQANTLEYFAVCLYEEKDSEEPTEHDSPHEQWNSMAGFPIIPNLHTFVLYECSGQIPKEEFCYLFPVLRNLKIIECDHRQVAERSKPNIMDYPLEIPISSNPSMFVRSIRGIKPTMELAQIFPSVTELHIEEIIPHKLPIYWPKLKHLYYKDSFNEDDQYEVANYIRRINKFLVGILPEECKRIGSEGHRNDFDLTQLELPRSRPSIFDLKELETFEFGFSSYEFKYSSNSTPIRSALGVLITLGLSRLTHLKKLNFVLEQKPRPRTRLTLPRGSLDGLVDTFLSRQNFKTSSDCDEPRMEPEPHPRKFTLEFNLDHHKSEWTEIDGLFRDDPDVCDLGLRRDGVDDDEF